MSILANELVWRKSAVVEEGGGNGGRMGSVVSASASKNNIWPDVPQSERNTGSTKYRKMFILVNNVELDGSGNKGLALLTPRVFVETRTPGQDHIEISLGGQRDTQSNIASPPWHGMAELQDPAVATDTSIVVICETDPAVTVIFRSGDVIRISDKADVNAAGNEEYHTISGAPGLNGNEVTLTLSAPLANSYSAGAGTKVSSVIEPGDISCTITGYNNGTGGAHSVAGIQTDATGTIEQTWALNFVTASTYNIVGDEVGTLPGGPFSIVGDISPSNPLAAGDYFTVKASGFTGGTIVAGQAIDFITHPAAIPLWYRRVVPAGAVSLSNNSVIVAIDGESS